MKTLVLFPDTNLFLQCLVLKDLPWTDLGFDRIELLIGATVQDEIDRHKLDGDTRRGRRARAANGRFREALDCLPLPLVIRAQRPEVLLTFAPPLLAARATPPTLDRTRGDDALIEEAVLYASSLPAIAVQIATLDTGMLVRARRHGLACFRIPEAWLLPAEADPREKRIVAMEKELAALKQAEPVLTVEIRDAGGQVMRPIRAEIGTFPALTVEDIDGLEASVRARCPRSEWGRSFYASQGIPLDVLDPPDREAIARYDAAYAGWLAKARKEFERLSNRLNMRARMVPFQLRLQNAGTVPADELLVEVSVRAGLALAVAEHEEPPTLIRDLRSLKDSVILEEPPPKPQGGLQGLFSDVAYSGFFRSSPTVEAYVSGIAGNVRPAHRDRHSFYLREDDSKVLTKVSLECAEFRHAMGARDLRGWIIIPPDQDREHSHLYCRVSARNLSRPVWTRVPLELSYATRSTVAVAEQWICRSAKGKGRR